ncbi:MAG TPA: DNA translocase FtsK 4TM domain-containing protein [Oligoflexus sp.]|uniref:DNA translocase FtsK n=1 Tax=Oligoflexus sp. TaxID=1971216 RepID=UPI002D23A3B2|nr:DNA translocase FtsK 4TM domain-containing protein [Oligoflexus sp.]HYX36603.1 DNA translocase FtsK 4TM domain-containing protein [Oligoflexus sp.]
MADASSPSDSKGMWQALRRFRLIRPEDGYSQEIVLLVILIGSAFTLASLVSFSPFDPSSYNFSFPPRTPQNVGGMLGSYLAASLIYRLGVVAFLLPLPWLWMSVACVLGQNDAFRKSRIVGWGLLFVNLLMAAAEWAPDLSIEGLKYLPGGAGGYYMHKSFTYGVGQAGLTIFLIASLVLALVMIRQQPLVKPALESLRDQWLQYQGLQPSRTSFWSRFQWKKKAKVAAPVREEMRTPSFDEPAVAPAPMTSPLAGITIKEMVPNEIVSPAPSEKVKVETPVTLEKTTFPDLEESTDASYEPPPAGLFRTSPFVAAIDDGQKKEFEQTAESLVKAFSEFGIGGEIIAIQPGPVVTVYEFQPHAGTKLAKVTGLLDDIALALRVDSIFIHPVSGKRALGVQVPNKKRDTVFLGDLVQNQVFQNAQSPLTFALGKALNGEPICCDLAAMPHLLMAGQTGSGKSVAINALLCSLILKARPEQVRMILVDPKILELKIYEGIPHLLMPVITEPLKASLALKWACQEMDRRYQLMETSSVRHLTGFNQWWDTASMEQKDTIRERFPDHEINKLPFIVIVIDELADLMLMASKDVEASIQRLAQKARASGIHLVLATQRPSVDVITGVIKANLPSRIAFKVFSRIDSRTILDSMGAERLLGKGDTLFLRPGSSRLERIQGAFLSDEEVVTMVDHIKKSSEPHYDASAMEWIDAEYQRQANPSGMEAAEAPGGTDPKWGEAIAIAQRQGAISASYLQRMLKIGYNRAARIVEAMEAQGLVAKADGSKPRAWIGSST